MIQFPILFPLRNSTGQTTYEETKRSPFARCEKLHEYGVTNSGIQHSADHSYETVQEGKGVFAMSRDRSASAVLISSTRGLIPLRQTHHHINRPGARFRLGLRTRSVVILEHRHQSTDLVCSLIGSANASDDDFIITFLLWGGKASLRSAHDFALNHRIVILSVAWTSRQWIGARSAFLSKVSTENREETISETLSEL